MLRRTSVDTRTVEKKLSLLAAYYHSDNFTRNLWLPPRMGRHHLRVEVWKPDGTHAFIRIRTSISTSTDVRNLTIRLTPSGIFFTPVEWLDPTHLRLTRGTVRDIMLTSPLYFDVDIKKGEKIQAAQIAVAKLIEIIRNISDREPDLLVFSGRNGFHIYYWNWDEIPIQFGNPKDRINEFIKSRRQLLRYLGSKHVNVDNTVTADPWRILRLPGSVHWQTGMIACQVRDLNEFLPKQDATPFPTDTYREIFHVNLELL